MLLKLLKVKITFSIVFLSLISSYCNAEIKNTECNSEPLYVNKVFYVQHGGRPWSSDGSLNNPFPSINRAVTQVPDGATILVKKGLYKGQIRIKRKFNQGIIIKSEVPYQAQLTNNMRVIAFTNNASHITLEGFEIFHNNKKSKPLVIHIDGGASNKVNNITIKNNIIHDSFNNDLLKINNGAENINVVCNMFYNQGDSDEHIDINSAKNVKVTGNLFFNAFEKSNRTITKKSASYIVVKDSNNKEDNLLGAEDISIDGNIFFNWQGSHGHGFILVGEDGKDYYEANKVSIFNNLFLGNSKISMRSPLGIKGAKNVYFYNNTITGDLPSNAYAIRVNREGNNLINNNIALFNNMWSDPTGTMGSGDYETSIDFSDTTINQLGDYYFDNNLVYNGHNKIPYSFFDKINPTDDKHLKTIDPNLPKHQDMALPVWDIDTQRFSGRFYSIEDVFIDLLYLYGIPESSNILYDNNQGNKTPDLDIMGNIRLPPYSLGAVEQSFNTKN